MMHPSAQRLANPLPERFAQLLRFGCAGVIVLGIDFSLLFLFGKFLPPLATVSIAYSLAVCAHFCLNKWWVFRASTGQPAKEVVTYGLTAFLCWCSTVLCVKAALAWLTNHLLLAKLAAIPPTMALGFSLMRFLVFQRSRQAGKKAV